MKQATMKTTAQRCHDKPLTREETMNRCIRAVEAMLSYCGNTWVKITYEKLTNKSILDFSEWDRQRLRLYAGDEVFLIWDNRHDNCILYAVNVTADSVLTAMSELTYLIAVKF